MDLREYVRTARQNWLLIAAATLAGLLLAGGISVVSKPTYVSDTQLFVAIQNSGTIQELQQGNTFSQARVQSYVKTVESPVVLQPVIDSLGLSASASELATRVHATADLNTVLITISATDTSPVQAAAVAQAVADSLIRAIDSLEKPKTGGSSPVSMSVIQPAIAPTQPSSPNVRLNLIIGFLVGLTLGLAAAILRTTLDNRIRGEADLRLVSDAPLLGGIAYDVDATKKPLLTQSGSQSPRAESFRQLRTNLQFANVSSRVKTIVVTSSLPGEGKSTTATNLAISLAQDGKSVCLIDADLRRPMIGEYLGLDQSAGLTTALVGAADLNDLLQPWGQDSLYVLTSGQLPPNPSELLGSAEMQELISGLEQAFDSVVIDAPPLLPVTDAAVLSQHVGGVVLVAGSLKIKQQDLAKSFQTLELVGANLLGVVLNWLPMKGPDAYAYGYYSNEAITKSTRSTVNSDSRRESEEARPPAVYPAQRIESP